ncbi:MAG: hypothetical protein GY815_17075 [Gammaproteobacteria bacterium]|nr:hypothetical protein [Gammaproteobacteria bacterium]
MELNEPGRVDAVYLKDHDKASTHCGRFRLAGRKYRCRGAGYLPGERHYLQALHTPVASLLTSR